MDVDHDGHVTKDEFIGSMLKLVSQVCAEHDMAEKNKARELMLKFEMQEKMREAFAGEECAVEVVSDVIEDAMEIAEDIREEQTLKFAVADCCRQLWTTLAFVAPPDAPPWPCSKEPEPEPVAAPAREAPERLLDGAYARSRGHLDVLVPLPQVAAPVDRWARTRLAVRNPPPPPPADDDRSVAGSDFSFRSRSSRRSSRHSMPRGVFSFVQRLSMKAAQRRASGVPKDPGYIIKLDEEESSTRGRVGIFSRERDPTASTDISTSWPRRRRDPALSAEAHHGYITRAGTSTVLTPRRRRPKTPETPKEEEAPPGGWGVKAKSSKALQRELNQSEQAAATTIQYRRPGRKSKRAAAAPPRLDIPWRRRRGCDVHIPRRTSRGCDEDIPWRRRRGCDVDIFRGGRVAAATKIFRGGEAAAATWTYSAEDESRLRRGQIPRRRRRGCDEDIPWGRRRGCDVDIFRGGERRAAGITCRSPP